MHNVGPHEDIGGTVTSIMSFALHCYRVMVVLVCTAGKGESNRYMRASNPLTVTVPPELWHGVPWWEEWTGGARWNPQPPTLHQASPQYYASLGDGRFWTDPPSVTVPPQSWHGVPWWEEWTGGARWNPQPPTLHQDSPQYFASLGDGRFWTEPFCMPRTMPCPLQHETQLLFWHYRMWRSWTGQLGVQSWTPLSIFETKWGSGSETKQNNVIYFMWHLVLYLR